MEAIMDPESRRLTNMTSAATAALSFVTQTIPAADELLVVPVHYWFAVSFTHKRGLGLWRTPWIRVSGIIWGGAGARLVANFALGLIPVAGAFSNVVTAVALTELLARYLDGALGDSAASPRP